MNHINLNQQINTQAPIKENNRTKNNKFIEIHNENVKNIQRENIRNNIPSQHISQQHKGFIKPNSLNNNINPQSNPLNGNIQNNYYLPPQQPPPQIYQQPIMQTNYIPPPEPPAPPINYAPLYDDKIKNLFNFYKGEYSFKGKKIVDYFQMNYDEELINFDFYTDKDV